MQGRVSLFFLNRHLTAWQHSPTHLMPQKGATHSKEYPVHHLYAHYMVTNRGPSSYRENILPKLTYSQNITSQAIVGGCHHLVVQGFQDSRLCYIKVLSQILIFNKVLHSQFSNPIQFNGPQHIQQVDLQPSLSQSNSLLVSGCVKSIA